MIKQVTFAEYQDVITSMMQDMAHLEPIGLDIDVQSYLNAENSGHLKAFLMRESSGCFVGVALIFVSTSLRNAAIKEAATDVLYVKPNYRGNSTQYIDAIKAELTNMGVNYWYAASRDSHPISKFLTKNDFKPLERLFFCKLNEV